jgi:hypothetical protein
MLKELKSCVLIISHSLRPGIVDMFSTSQNCKENTSILILDYNTMVFDTALHTVLPPGKGFGG